MLPRDKTGDAKTRFPVFTFRLRRTIDRPILVVLFRSPYTRVKGVLMTRTTMPPRQAFFHPQVSEFWSGDLGLTLITISLVVLVFVITPLREVGLPGRQVFDLILLSLMVFGALAVEQSRIAKLLVIAFVLMTAGFLGAGRFHPTPLLHQLGSVLSTITLLLYVCIVLIVMFRGGTVTWSRIRVGCPLICS